MDTALYFPHMRLPRSAWLMQVLLYWDRAATIVPEYELDDPIAGDPFMRDLRSVGLLIPVSPDRQHVAHESFVDGFLALVDAQGSHESHTTVRIHADKMGYPLFRQLQDRGLAEVPDFKWWLVEQSTALLYMAYLASAISAANPGMIPVTDTSASMETLGAGARTRERVDALRYAVITRALPVPAQPVSARDLAAFKERHADALNRCRRFLDNRLVDVAKIDDLDEREVRLAAFSQEISDDVARLVDAMKRKQWPRVTLGAFGGVVAPGLQLAQTIVGGATALEMGLAAGAAALEIGATAYAMGSLRNDRFDGQAPLAYAALTTRFDG